MKTQAMEIAAYSTIEQPLWKVEWSDSMTRDY